MSEESETPCDEEVLKLAESLRQNGLFMPMADALELARKILGARQPVSGADGASPAPLEGLTLVPVEATPTNHAPADDAPAQPESYVEDYDISREGKTLNEIMAIMGEQPACAGESSGDDTADPETSVIDERDILGHKAIEGDACDGNDASERDTCDGNDARAENEASDERDVCARDTALDERDEEIGEMQEIQEIQDGHATDSSHDDSELPCSDDSSDEPREMRE